MNKQINNEQLISINVNEQQEPVVSGRELHKALEIGTEYAKWFSRMVEYGFVENQDFAEVIVKNDENSKGGRPSTDHAMKLDMAKEIAMIQRSEKGKEVRKYFIQVEKDFNSPEKIMARALKIAEHQISVLRLENTEQKQIIEEQEPKVAFANAITASKNSILIRELARLISQNGIKIGERSLYTWLRENGYVEKNSTKATQKAINLKVLELVERTSPDKEGNFHTNFTTYVTPKGQAYFIGKFLENREMRV